MQYLAPQVRRLQVDEGGKAAIYPIALPPLIWAGWRGQYCVFALGSTQPISAETPLYHAPLPNVYTGGGICWGNVRVPRASAQTMGQALKLFLEESQFNTHLDGGKSRTGGSVLAVWRTLAKKEPAPPYPLDDLLPATRRLGALLDGTIWRQR